MNKNSVIFKIFKIENNERKFVKDYYFDINMKIVDIKNNILSDCYNNDYNSLDLENITVKVYKDFGKLFFEKGLLPISIDNYKLSDFTIENRTFEFVVYGKNVQKKEIEKKKNNINLLQKNINKEYKNNKISKEFVIIEEDFPALKPKIK